MDLRGILLANDMEILPEDPGAAGYVAFAPVIDIAFVWGTPTGDALDALATRVARGTQVVCGGESRDRVAAHVGAILAEPLHLYALPKGAVPALPKALPGVSVRIVRQSQDAALDHLPAHLREEMDAALGRTFVAMTFVEGRAVAFCYAHHETERFWDVSVDTLEDQRRRGHAARAFGFASAAMLDEGKAAVWGALDSNVASKGMALRLGMAPIAENFLLIAAGPPGGP